MPQLTQPTPLLHRSWLAARDDWAGAHQDGAGLRLGDDLDSAEGFAAWVGRLRGSSDGTTQLDAGHVPSTRSWITEEDTCLGAIEVRHSLTPLMLDAIGHIGYSIRPSARRRGLATWALGEVLPKARTLGLHRVLLTCDDGNVASARTIERNGGVLEDARDTALGHVS